MLKKAAIMLTLLHRWAYGPEAEGPLLNSFSISGGVELRKKLPKGFMLGVGFGYYRIKAFKRYNIGHGGPEASHVVKDIYVEIPVLFYKKLFQFREGKSHLHLLGGAVFVLSTDEKAKRQGNLIKDNPLVPTLGLSYMHEFKEKYYWNADFRFPYFTLGMGAKF